MSTSNFNTASNITAKIWADSNFAVDNLGNLYSKSGKIGGWNIGENVLWAGSSVASTTPGIRLSNTGNLSGGSYSAGSTTGSNSGWVIDQNGEAVFNGITVKNATIQSGNFGGGITIGGGAIHGSNDSFIISPTQATFTGLNINVTNGTASMGGGGGGSFYSPGLSANGSASTIDPDTILTPAGTTLNGYFKDLVVSGTFTYQNKNVTWQASTIVTSIAGVPLTPLMFGHIGGTWKIPVTIDSEGKVTDYVSLNTFLGGLKWTSNYWYLMRGEFVSSHDNDSGYVS